MLLNVPCVGMRFGLSLTEWSTSAPSGTDSQHLGNGVRNHPLPAAEAFFSTAGPDTQTRQGFHRARLTFRVADSLLCVCFVTRAQFSLPAERVVCQAGVGASSAVRRRSGLLDAHLRTVTVGLGLGDWLLLLGALVLFFGVVPSGPRCRNGVPPAGQGWNLTFRGFSFQDN